MTDAGSQCLQISAVVAGKSKIISECMQTTFLLLREGKDHDQLRITNATIWIFSEIQAKQWG